MIQTGPTMRILVATKPVDFRNYAELCIIAKAVMVSPPHVASNSSRIP